MVRSLESVPGPRLLQLSAWRLLQDTGRRVRASAPSPTRAGRVAQYQEGPGCWVLGAGGSRGKVGDTQRQYTPSGTVDAGTRGIGVPGDTWRREELGSVGP